MRAKRNLSVNKASSQRRKHLHRQHIKMIHRRQFYFSQLVVAEQLINNVSSVSSAT